MNMGDEGRGFATAASLFRPFLDLELLDELQVVAVVVALEVVGLSQVVAVVVRYDEATEGERETCRDEHEAFALPDLCPLKGAPEPFPAP
jgi:hypothetical protein